MKYSKNKYVNKLFWFNKRMFDIIFSLLLLPLLCIIIIVLLCVNNFSNPGKLFFIQKRMGTNCNFFLQLNFVQ